MTAPLGPRGQMAPHQEPDASAATDGPRTTSGPSRSARRFGHLVAAGFNGVGLFIVHHLLEWGWPPFLTESFAEVLPVVTASLVAGIVANLVLVVTDPGWLRALTDAVTAAITVAVGWRMIRVYPFDFSGYDHDWSWLVSLVLVLGTIVAAIACATAVVRFLRCAARRPAP